jgi:hypothetical protein
MLRINDASLKNDGFTLSAMHNKDLLVEHAISSIQKWMKDHETSHCYVSNGTSNTHTHTHTYILDSNFLLYEFVNEDQ